jgi:hypothetical protein
VEDTVTTVGQAVSAPGLAAGIWPRTTRLEPGGEISVGGVSLGDLAARYGTPAYIVAEADVRYRCQAYREAFPAAEIASVITPCTACSPRSGWRRCGSTRTPPR